MAGCSPRLLTGAVDVSPNGDAVRARILSKVLVTPEGCWEFQGHRSAGGYCNMSVGGQQARVHRLAYAAFVGPFERRLLVCHHCDNPPCCNPQHLFLGDHTANAKDAGAKGRLHGGANRLGEAHPLVTVDDARARDAVRRYRAGEFQRQIARDLGVAQTTVSNWVRGGTRVALGGAR